MKYTNKMNFQKALKLKKSESESLLISITCQCVRGLHLNKKNKDRSNLLMFNEDRL